MSKAKLGRAIGAAWACFVVFTGAAAHASVVPGAAGQILALVNQERAQAGLGALTLDPQLSDGAQRYAEAMGAGGFYAHDGPDGSTPLSRMNAAGFPGSGTWGENIAAGQTSAEAVMQAWMNSPGHRSNILNPSFTHIGIGAASVPGSQWNYYWVQDFGVRVGGGGGGSNTGGSLGGSNGGVPQPTPQPQAQGPSLTRLSPNQGSAGDTVTLVGQNFGSQPGVVSFSGATARLLSWSPSQIQVQVPAGAASGAVYVQNNAGTSNGVHFAVLASAPAQPSAPQATYVFPGSGNPGTRVTIYGRSFGMAPGHVLFNGVAGQVVYWYDTLIGVNVPAGATSGPLVVQAPGGDAGGLDFTVNAGDPSATQPQLVYAAPASGAVGTQVALIGHDLGSQAGAVSFGGVAATIVNWTPSAVVALVPEGASTGEVTVQTGGGTSNGVAFTVIALSPPPASQPDALGSSVPTPPRTLRPFVRRSPYRWFTTRPTSKRAGGSTPPVHFGSGAGASLTNAPPGGPPTASGLTPSVAKPGAAVTIHGSNFGAAPGAVRIGRSFARVVSWGDGEVVVEAPAGIGTTGQVIVRVIRSDGQQSGVLFLGLSP